MLFLNHNSSLSWLRIITQLGRNKYQNIYVFLYTIHITQTYILFAVNWRVNVYVCHSKRLVISLCSFVNCLSIHLVCCPLYEEFYVHRRLFCQYYSGRRLLQQRVCALCWLMTQVTGRYASNDMAVIDDLVELPRTAHKHTLAVRMDSCRLQRSSLYPDMTKVITIVCSLIQ